MDYMGDVNAFLAVLAAPLGLGIGWLLRGVYESRSLRLTRHSTSDRWSQDRAKVLAHEVDLQASQERLAIRESEISELQSLLSLAEQEKDNLRDRERRLVEQLRDLEKGVGSSPPILVH